MTRQTSIEAYNKIKENGLLSKRRWEVYDILFRHGPMTAGEIFKVGNLEGMWKKSVKATVCSRLTELRMMGVAEELPHRICSESGMTTILWMLNDREPVKFEKPKRIECPHCDGKGYVESSQGRLL